LPRRHPPVNILSAFGGYHPLGYSFLFVIQTRPAQFYDKW
jgi:hypothetical protein